MQRLQSSIEVSSLSVLGDLIFLDEGSASKVFSQLCGLDREEGISAIRTFQARVRGDRSWLALLAQIDTDAARNDPAAVMRLLTEGFGLYELDALDVVFRLCEQETKTVATHLLN